jgi:hypothetical protein
MQTVVPATERKKEDFKELTDDKVLLTLTLFYTSRSYNFRQTGVGFLNLSQLAFAASYVFIVRVCRCCAGNIVSP